MASIRNLKEPSGNVFYPLTHERAVKDSNGVSLESKLAGLESKSYVEAWDGASTPVVANIPAGVTVTYNTTTYTGTLAASASTEGKVYLVKNGNDYDRYITSQSGSSYSWSPIGSTEMDLSGYATDAEFASLDDGVTIIGNNIGEIPPEIVSKDLGYERQDKTFWNGYDASNNANSSNGVAPFFLDFSAIGVILKIRAKFVTVGAFTVGKFKRSDIWVGATFDSTKIIVKKTYSIETTGELEIEIEPMLILEDEIFFVSYPGDGATFKYGQNGQNLGFWFVSSGTIVTTNSSLGIDIIGYEINHNDDAILEHLGVTHEEKLIFNSFSAAAAIEEKTQNSPFIVNRDFRKTYITKIRLNVYSAGTITVGKVKKVNAVVNSIFDRSNVFGNVTILANYPGTQNIYLGDYLLNEDEFLCIGMPTDTGTFVYGGSAVDSSFLYVNSSEGNILRATDSALGIDIYSSEYNQISYYNGKKLSILGDSISTFSGYIPTGNETYYPSGTVQSVNDTWWKKLIDALGLVLDTNNSWSGSRVTTTGGETSAGCMTRAQSLGTPDVIIVWMGINDFNNEVALGTYDGKSVIPSTTTTFREAYAIMLNKILTAYPSAEVWVCTLPQCERNSPSGFPEINGNGVALIDFNIAIEELARAFGVKVLDHNRCGLTYQNMSVFNPDQLHPNKFGHSLVANNDIRQMDNYVRYRYATE